MTAGPVTDEVVAPADTSQTALRRLTSALAANAERYDRTAEFPWDSIQAVHDAGILTLGIGARYGGQEQSPPGINTQDAATAAKISGYFTQGAATTDQAQRAAVYADLQKYIIEQGVAFPIYERVQVSGLSSKVHGFAWTSESFLRANDIWLSG